MFLLKKIRNHLKTTHYFRSKTLDNYLSITLITIGFLYTAVRAHFLSLTHDEAITYLVHASGTYLDILKFNLPVTSNNHLLNSILIKLFTGLFGTSEFVIRIPALIGHALYLYGVWKLLGLFLKGHRLFLGLCLLIFHPFLIDLFSCARGYSLGMGFMTLGLYYFFKRINNYEIKKDIKDSYIAWIMLAFSVLSHLSFLDAFIPMILLYILCEIMLLVRKRDSSNIISNIRNYQSLFAPPMISSVLLAVVYTLPIVKMIRVGNQFIGGSEGFWRDTVQSLIYVTLFDKLSRAVPIIFLISQILVVVILAVACEWLLCNFLNKRGFSDVLTIYLLWLLMFLIICPMSIILQHYLLSRPFPIDRYGIYLVIIYFLLILALWENLGKIRMKLVRGAVNLFYLIIVVLLVHFIMCTNISYYYSWKYDSSTKEMIGDLVKIARNTLQRDSLARLGVSWFFEPSVNYYRERNKLRWLERVDQSGPEDEFNYYYVTSEDSGLKNKYDLELVKRYDLSDTYLFAWRTSKTGKSGEQMRVPGPRRRNCVESVSATRWKGEYFPNKTLSGPPLMVRDDGDGFIKFQWARSPASECSIGSDNFSVRWTRRTYFKKGTYRFALRIDDGFRFFIDNQLILDKWFDQGPTDYTADYPIVTGNHTIIMEYYQAGGGAMAYLSWDKK